MFRNCKFYKIFTKNIKETKKRIDQKQNKKEEETQIFNII